MMKQSAQQQNQEQQQQRVIALPQHLRSRNESYNQRMAEGLQRILTIDFGSDLRQTGYMKIAIAENDGRYRRTLGMRYADDDTGNIRRFAITYMTEHFVIMPPTSPSHLLPWTAEEKREETDHAKRVLDAMESLMRNESASFPGSPDFIWGVRGGGRNERDLEETYEDRKLSFKAYMREGPGDKIFVKLVVQVERFPGDQAPPFPEQQYPGAAAVLRRRGLLD